MKNIDVGKIAICIFAVVSGLLVSYYAQPLVHNNDEAVNVIVTVFSVLAGFLVAIIAIIGDPMLIPPGSWRAAELGSHNLTRRLLRHKWLFIIYLLSLGLIFISVLLKSACTELVVWIERVYLFLSSVAFICSLWLPGTLMRMQKERIDHEIEHRRNPPSQNMN
jgi:hypothetical protein